ncbi:ChaN family lipoprotein [Hymenobacter rubripertinctus]|uniref:Iron-regulated protein n=1 Tax=Hymenobacter rubripertinctus TaxID=2029981 RepID=A0A418QWK0_9BACT|nr:ChaN family lipoprotein [Hymenobacter rubripertinctus]RIY09548.1 iron-regulated protein [Hymenobacter rubripertinctus]
MRILLLLLLLLGSAAHGQDRPAYRLFTAAGQPVRYEAMLKTLAATDVVFFGEQHNDPIGHWLELQLTRDLLRLKQGRLVLGLEMFERDVQHLVDAYTTGELTDEAFEAQSRPWPNYATDYRPLLRLARQQKFRVVGTNVPRPYARQVAYYGPASLDTISAQAKTWLMPLPLRVDYNLPGYQKMAALMGESTHGNTSPQKMVAAQALKDATMAYYLNQARPPGHLLLHLNGSYHSDNHDGILAYLRQQNPQLKVLTISTVSQEQLAKLEQANQQKADFVLVVPTDMTRTY